MAYRSGRWPPRTTTIRPPTTLPPCAAPATERRPCGGPLPRRSLAHQTRPRIMRRPRRACRPEAWLFVASETWRRDRSRPKPAPRRRRRVRPSHEPGLGMRRRATSAHRRLASTTHPTFGTPSIRSLETMSIQSNRAGQRPRPACRLTRSSASCLQALPTHSRLGEVDRSAQGARSQSANPIAERSSPSTTLMTRPGFPISPIDLSSCDPTASLPWLCYAS